MKARRTPGHGTRARYGRGCRCEDCREAARIYFKRMRERRLPPGLVDSTGTVRRVRALAAAGWSFAAQGQWMGTSDRWPGMLANQSSETVTLSTADRVKAMYAALQNQPGTSAKAKTWAAKRGWLGPAWWDDDASLDDPSFEPLAEAQAADTTVIDEVAVDRALRGFSVRLTKVERHFAIHEGRRRGTALNAVAATLGMNYQTAVKLAAKPLPAMAA